MLRFLALFVLPHDRASTLGRQLRALRDLAEEALFATLFDRAEAAFDRTRFPLGVGGSGADLHRKA